jgi:HPt (histidine-containing phosphotransfer) domain-containing protein
VQIVFPSPAEFAEQFGGDHGICLEIAVIAEKDMRERWQELQTAATGRDPGRATKVFHAMRGIVGTFGCEEFVAFLTTAENTMENCTDFPSGLIDEAENHILPFLEALNEFEKSFRAAS